MSDNLNQKIKQLAEQFENRIDRIASSSLGGNEIDKEQVRLILRRYNSVWEDNPATYWDESGAETVNFVPETIPEEIYDYVSHPFFRRMNFIRQLSTTPLQRHLGATHSRLSHSYGVTAIASAFVDSLQSEDGVEISETEKKSLYIYCYAHDAFHGPFGHSLDSLKEYFNLSNHNRKLDKNLLYNEIKEGGRLYELIHSEHDQNEAQEIIRLLTFFMNPGRRDLQQQYADKYFLTDVVDSVVDADRLDYLYRDSHNLGHPEPMDADLRRLISGASTQEVTTEKGVSVRALSWNQSYEENIEQLLQTRRKFYRKYYESTDKIAIDEMLSHALYNFVEHFDIDASRGRDRDIEIMKRLAYLTDTELLHFLREVSQPFITNELVRDLYRGHFYTPIEEYELAFPGEAAGDPNKQNKFDQFNQILSMEEPTPPFTPTEVAEIRRAVEQADLDIPQILFIMSDLLINRYHSKANIEALLRDSILSDDILYDKWRRANLRKYGLFDEIDDLVPEELKRWEQFTRIPFIYIYFPTHVEWLRGTQGNIEDDIEFWLKEKEPTRIHWHDENGDSVNNNLDIPLRESFKSKRVVLCGPQFLSEGDAKERVCEIFKDLVRDTNRWLQDDIVGSV